MITIHWDFTDKTEVSWIEGQELLENNKTDFTTCCLDFFCFDTITNVRVVKRDGRFIDRDELLSDTNKSKEDKLYTYKAIRLAHNIRKMLVAGSFAWRLPTTVTEKKLLLLSTYSNEIIERVDWAQSQTQDHTEFHIKVDNKTIMVQSYSSLCVYDIESRPTSILTDIIGESVDVLLRKLIKYGGISGVIVTKDR